MIIFQNSAILFFFSMISSLFVEKQTEELKLISGDEPNQLQLQIDTEIKCYEIFELRDFYGTEYYVPIFFSTEIQKFESFLIIDLTNINLNIRHKVCVMTTDDNYIWSEEFYVTIYKNYDRSN